MILAKLIQRILPFTTIIVLFSCTNTQHSISGIESAMKRYDNLILKLDADSISMLYAPDGNLGNIAIGRDSIKKFLSSFKNVRVLSQSSITKSINLVGDSAVQKGTYDQTDIISNKDTVKVKGEYTANWQWISGKGWFISRMMTKPIK